MNSILGTISAMRPAAPVPNPQEEEALSLERRADEKRAAGDKQKGEDLLPESAGKHSEVNAASGAESIKTRELTAPQQIASAPVVDQYVHGQEPEPAGLYRTVPDENGLRSIAFDDPEKKTDGEKAAEKAERKEPAPEKEEETVTGNTDKVDAEIRKLKEKLKSLQQQLARAQDDPQEQAKLEKEISQVENELRTKDTDAYRRQHTQFS